MKQIPTDIKLHTQSRVLEVVFQDITFILPCEYLRVYSPSAEVKGHGPDQAILQVGKENVNIVAIEPVGHYAVKLVFSDKHNSGLYSWDFLYELGKHRQHNWQDYLARLSAAGVERETQPYEHLLVNAD